MNLSIGDILKETSLILLKFNKKETINTAFTKTEYQRCIVHKIRNTIKYVFDKDRKLFYRFKEHISSAYGRTNPRKPETNK